MPRLLPAAVTILVIAGIVLFLVPGLGSRPRSGPTTLRWQLHEGDRLSYRSEQTITTAAAGVNGTVTQVLDNAWVVNGVEPDGTARITQILERVQSKQDAPTGSVEYDSQEGT